MYGAGNSNTDVSGLVDAESRFCVWLGRVHLIKLFIVTLLEIDDGSVARPADLDHGEAVGGRVSKCNHAVQKAGGGHRETDPRLLRQIAGDRRCVTSGLLVAEADIANS